jgi:hypothetical protein
LIDKSKSSVSRALELITDQGFCSYILEDNEHARAERKYYIKGSFKELTINRTEKSLWENSLLKTDLLRIKQSIPVTDKESNQELLTKIDLFCDLVDILTINDKRFLEILREHYKDED